MITETIDSREGQRHAGALNGRQPEVLERIARGHAHREIAGALGITLEGAKGNVSEILTKLGFGSREEATNYWMSRQEPGRRMARALHGLAPVGMAKWILVAGGGLGIVAAVLVAAFFIMGTGDETAADPNGVSPFHIQIRVEVCCDEAQSPRVSVVDWRYRDNRHYRWTIENKNEAGDDVRIEAVADGEDRWLHQLPENTYSRMAISDEMARYFPSLPISALIGPVPYETVDELMAAFPPGANPAKFSRIVGEDVVLGRKVTIIEFGPTWSSSSSSAPSGGPTVDKSGGTGRLWIDETTMIVLRFETGMPDPVRVGTDLPGAEEEQTIIVEVTSLTFEDSADAVFRFVPPAGAVPRKDNSNRGSGSSPLVTPIPRSPVPTAE